MPESKTITLNSMREMKRSLEDELIKMLGKIGPVPLVGAGHCFPFPPDCPVVSKIEQVMTNLDKAIRDLQAKGIGEDVVVAEIPDTAEWDLKNPWVMPVDRP